MYGMLDVPSLESAEARIGANHLCHVSAAFEHEIAMAYFMPTCNPSTRREVIIV